MLNESMERVLEMLAKLAEEVLSVRIVVACGTCSPMITLDLR